MQQVVMIIFVTAACGLGIAGVIDSFMMYWNNVPRAFNYKAALVGLAIICIYVLSVNAIIRFVV